MHLLRQLPAALLPFLGLADSRTLDKRQAGVCASPVVRRSWVTLSNDEKLAYINAEKCLQSTPPQYGIAGAKNVWDELQFAHVRAASHIHGVGAFLPWHRYYMTVHERLLQKHCGFAGGVPYWLEASDAANVWSSPIWDTTYGFGGDGTGPNGCVATGPFAGLTLQFQADFSYANPYCLSRAINASDFQDADQAHVDECFNNNDYWTAVDCYANAPHWSAHAGVGRVMGDGMLAPGEPIFFLHHTNLDRLFYEWQRVDPGRLSVVGGPNVPTEAFIQASGFGRPGPEFTSSSGDPGDVTTLDHVLWMAGIMPNVTIRDVMDIRGSTICATYA